MKKLSGMTLLLSAALLLLALPPAFSAEEKKKTGSRKKEEVKFDVRDRVTAVHLTSITVTLDATHASKEYKVTPATKITIDGKPGTLANISTGMNVSVATAADPTVAESIDARTRPAEKNERPKKKK